MEAANHAVTTRGAACTPVQVHNNIVIRGELHVQHNWLFEHSWASSGINGSGAQRDGRELESMV